LTTLRHLPRVAHAWKQTDAVPKIKMLDGEVQRDCVLSRALEPKYLAALPDKLRDIAIVLLEAGLRVGECLRLEWSDVKLKEDPGYVTVRGSVSKNHKPRTVPLTPRLKEVLKGLKGKSGRVFCDADGEPLYHTWLDQQHAAVREQMKLPADFVLHSLRHTFGTRLGETGADVFTIMKLMGHQSVTVSQRYVHPSSDAMRSAMKKMGSAHKVPTKAPTGVKARKAKSSVKAL
jgi:integrase